MNQDDRKRFMPKGETFSAQEVEKALDRVLDRLESSHQWYARRFDRLWSWAHSSLNEQQKKEYFNIVANGTASPYESPTYEQQFNTWKYRALDAEKRLAELEAERAMADVTSLKSVSDER